VRQKKGSKEGLRRRGQQHTHSGRPIAKRPLRCGRPATHRPCLVASASNAVGRTSNATSGPDQNLFTSGNASVEAGGPCWWLYWHVEEQVTSVVTPRSSKASPFGGSPTCHNPWFSKRGARCGTRQDDETGPGKLPWDSHGQSEIGFGITRLLEIDPAARGFFKRINTVRAGGSRERNIGEGRGAGGTG